MSCVITLPNGKDSLLFGSLQQLVPLTRAQELYYDYQAHSDKYRSLPKDLNGEPTVEAFVKFLRLDQPVEQSVRTFSSLSPAAQIQLQLFLNQWKMFDVMPNLYRGYFAVPVTASFGKKVINHYKNNSALDNYNAVWFKFNPMINALEFGNRIPPEVTLPGQGTLFNEVAPINIYSTDKNGYENLSNFFNGPFTINGKTYKTVEHAYQYAKAFRAGDKQAQEKILNATTGADAKSLGVKLRLTPEQLSVWQQENIGMLKMLMKTAFDQNPKNKELLISTGDATLTHYSPAKSSSNMATIWTKEFPRLLMEIRSEYQGNSVVQAQIETGTKHATVKSDSGILTYSGSIGALGATQVFVFGANDRGLHGRGAAGFAMYGQDKSLKFVEAEAPGKIGKWTIIGKHSEITQGLLGKSYPMVTVSGKVGGKRDGNRLAEEEFLRNIAKMFETAMANPDKEFLVAYSGWNPDKRSLNGYTPREMAAMFDLLPIPENVAFEENFSKLITNSIRRKLTTGEFQFETQADRETVKLDDKRLRAQQLLISAPILDAEGKEQGFFSAAQIDSVNGMIKRKLLEYLVKNGAITKKAKASILEDLTAIHKKMQERIDANNDSLKMFGGIEKAQELNNNLLMVIHSFDGLYGKVAKDLKVLYKVNFKKINQARATEAVINDEELLDDNGAVVASESTLINDEGSAREVFSKLSEMIDPRDTMTGRVKLMLSTIKKAEYGVEDPVVEKKLPISSNELRKLIITSSSEGNPIILPRTQSQAKEIKIVYSSNPKLSQGKVSLYYEDVDGVRTEKDFRVTAVGIMSQEEADEFNTSYLASLQKDKDGNQIVANKGDVKYQIEPFKVNESVLKDKIGWTGQPEVADMEEVFQAAIQSVHKVNPSQAEVMEALKEAGKSNGTLYRLAETLESMPQHYVNEFISVVRKQNQQFKTILLKINKKKGVGITVETRTIDSNRGSAQRILIENWKENQKVSDMVTPTASGDFLVNAQLVADLRTEMNALRAEYLSADISKEEVLQPLMEKAKAFVNKVLSANGIVLSTEMINDLVVNVGELTKNKERLTGATIFDHMRYGADGKALGFLSVLLDRSGDIQTLEDEEDSQSSVSKGNFLYTDKDITSILANLYIKYSGTLSTQSFKNVNGDVVYSFGHPTFLSDEFERMKSSDHRAAMSKIAFSSGNFLFRALDAGQNINLEYVDGFTITGKSGGTERSAMSPREQEIDFVNRVLRTDTQGDFYSLTHSDKTRTPLITNVTRTKAFSGEGYTRAMTEEFVSLFVAEYKRVVLAYRDAGTYGHTKYEQGNKLFYLTPFNKDSLKSAVSKGTITEDEYAEFYTADGSHSDVFKSGSLPASMQATVRKVVTYYMGYLSQIQESRWKEIGFMEEGLPLVNKKVINNMVWGRNLRPETDKRGKVLAYSAIDNQGQVVESLNVNEVNAYITKELAAEVALNSYIMNASLMQALYGDPAQFFKGDIEKTLVEYQKRLAGPIAPHRAMAIGAEEKFKAVTIEDLEIGLNIHPAYKSKINIADAQEWVTMKEWLYTNAQEGQITQEEYNDAIKIIESSPDGNYTFGTKLEGKIFGISKPVYYGNSSPVNGNVMFKTYIKSSAIPLYPPMTVGFELDKLRTWMEKNDVRRAHMSSAKKAGPGEAAKVFRANGTVDVENIQSSAIQTLDRRNLGIQQDNPYNADKKAIATVSQENKLVVATIDDDSDYTFLSGEVRNSRGVREFKEKVRIEMISRKMAELNEELSIDEKGRITNPKKAYNVLKALAEDNGIAPDELLLMETDANGSPFIHPFFLPSSRKYESLILSAVKKTLQVKITGKSYVQASAAGITKISEQGNLDISKVVWAKDVKELKFMEKTAGGVTPAQVLVPFNFFAGNKKLNIEDYMTDGKIDSSKLPPEVLHMVGARIPNQGHNSMLAIEIVGFLPTEMGDMMIVPNGITKQMGSDFDVDKLFVYQRPYNVTEEGITAGKVTETKDVSAYTDKELEHEYFDIHWAVLTNPNMYDKVLNPLDKPDITEESAKFGKISRAPFLSSVRQLSDYQMQVDAKALVGLSSLATTFNAVIQNKNLRAGALVADENGSPKQVDMPIIVHDENGKRIELVKLSGNATSYYNGQSRTKHDNITSMQSIFLDNAKDPHSGKLNLNLQTWPAAYAMVQLQTDNKPVGEVIAEDKALNLKYVTRLLSSSVIREYASRLVTSKDNLSDYNAAADDQVIEDIDSELVRRLSPETQSTLADSLDQVIFNEMSLEEMNSIPMNTTKSDEVLKLLALLRKFNEFRIVGRKLIELNSLFNQDTNGAGASIVTALDKKAKYNKIMQQDVVLNTRDLMYNNDGTYTEQGFLYTKVIEDYMDSLELLFPHSTLTHLFNDIRQMAGKDKLSIRQQEEILRSMKAYVFSSGAMGIYPDGIRAERVRLMYDTAEGPSLAKRVMQALQTTWGRENSFLQRLYTKINLADPSTVTYRATTQNKIEEIADKAAWTDLLTSDIKEARLIGEDLIRYTYIMGGVQDNNSFSKMIPTAFIQSTDISTYLNSMHGSKGTLAGKLNIESFTTQYFQHYPENTVGLTKELAELGGAVPGTVFTIPSEINNKTTHLFVNTAEGVMPAPFIHHMDENGNYRLYKLVEQNDRETRYQQIDTLGNKDVYEFDKGVGSIAKTVISRNMSPVEPPVAVIKPTRTVLDLEDGPQLVKPELVALGIRKSELSFAETMDVLNNMKSNSNLVKSQQLVSEILHDIMMSDSVLELAEVKTPFFELRPSTQNRAAIGGFTTSFTQRTGAYEIGMFLDPNKTVSSYVYAETFLHEMVHMQTRLITSAFTEEKYASLAPRLLAINPNIKEDVNRLADLYVEVNNLVKDNPSLLEGFNPTDQFDINYALGDIDEFITGVLTNKAFAKLLNGMTYKKTNKSVLQQFLDMIQKLILDLGNAITDGKFKTDSYLAESLRAIIPVAKYSSKTYDMVESNIVEFKSTNGKMYSLILDDDRNVVNVFEIVNGVAKPLADFTDVVNEYRVPVEPKAPAKATKYEIAPGVHMNKEQIEAMDTITDFLSRVDGDRSGMHEIALSGAAGTGKTTILKKILAEYKGNRTIRYLAPSHNARIELNAALGKNIAMTLQKGVRMVKDIQESDRQGKEIFKVNQFARKQIGFGDIIVLDESSMVNDELIDLLKQEVENGAIIIYTGDYAQLKPVGQSGLALPFRGNIPMTKLVQNMRSEKQDLTRVVDLVRYMIDAKTGNYEVMSDRVNSDSVTFTPSMQDVYNGFVADFSARDPRDLFNSVIITYRRKTRDAINSNVRRMLFGENLPEFVPGDLLRIDQIGIKIANTSKDITPVNPKDAKAVTDMILNEQIEDTVTPNERMVVKEFFAELEPMVIKVPLSDNKTVALKVDMQRIKVEKKASKDINVDVDLRFIPKEVVQNFILLAKASYNKTTRRINLKGLDSTIAQQLVDNFGLDTIGYSEFLQLKSSLEGYTFNYDYAYAATSHNVQGSSYKNVYVIEDDLEAVIGVADPVDVLKSMYVGVSRAREKLVIMHESRNRNVPTISQVNRVVFPAGMEANPGSDVVELSESWNVAYSANGQPTASTAGDARATLLANLLNKLTGIRKKLASQITESTREEKTVRADRQVRLQKLEMDIETIRNQMELNNIPTIAMSQLDWVRKIINTPSLSAKDLMTAFDIAIVWSNISEVMGTFDEQDMQGINETALSEVSGRASKLVGEMLTSTMINHMMANTRLKRTDLVNIQDEDMIANATRSLNSAKGQLAQMMGKLMTDSARMREEQTREDAFELEELDKKMDAYAKKKGLTKDAVMAKLVRKTSRSVTLINEFSPDWYKALYSMRAARDRTIDQATSIPALYPDRVRLIKDAYAKYWSEMKKIVHAVDIRNLVDIATGLVVTGDKYDAELAAVTAAYGVDGQAIVDQAIERFRKYLTDKEEFFLSVDTSANQKIDVIKSDNTIPDKEVQIATVEKERNDQKSAWMGTNSPIAFLESMTGNNSSRINRGDKYTVMIPDRAKNKDYYDATYDDMLKDPELKEMYVYVKSKIQHYLSMLPYDDTKNLVPNFFPLVDNSQLRTSASLKERIKNGAQATVEELSASQAQEAYRNSSGYEFLPVNFLHTGKDVDSVSTDITRVLEMFGNMAYHFRHFSNVKETYEIGETLLNQHNARVVRGIEPGESIMNLIQSVKHTKDSIMYRRPKKLQFNTGIRIFDVKANPWNAVQWSKEQKLARKHWEGLTKKVKKLEKERDNGTLTETEYQEQRTIVDAEIVAMENRSRTVYGSQIGDKLISFQQAKSLSYNPFSAFANWSFGYVSAINYGQGAKGLGDKGDYDTKSFKKAWATVGNSISNFFKGADSKQAMKIYKLMELSGVMGDVVDTMYGETQLSTRRDGSPNWTKPYEMMRQGDYNIRASVLVAIMMYRKAKVKNLKTGLDEYVPLWEMYDADGNFRTADYEAVGWHEKDIVDRTEWNKLKNRANKVLYTVMGNTDKNATKLIKSGILGRLISQFRLSWMPEGFASRWMDERYDQDLERSTKGRWREYKDIGIEGSVTIFKRMFFKMLGSDVDVFEGIEMKDGNDLQAHNMENMYRNFSGMAWTAGILLAGLMLRYIELEDDEDGQKKNVLKVLINTLYRLQQDLMFYSSTDTISTITGNAVPALRVVTDFNKAVQATWKAIEEDDYDWDQAALKWTKAGFPMAQASLINKVKFMAEKDLSTISR